MKLVIFGLTVTSSWGNGHATLWRGLCKAMARLGHRSVFFERDVPYYASHRDASDFSGGEVRLYRDWSEASERAASELANADVALITSYCPDALAATELALEAAHPLCVFYDLDTPITLDQIGRGGHVPYIGARGLRDFDLVLSYTGGTALTQLRRLLGARRVRPLYGHVDPDVHSRVAASTRYRADLSYLGTFAADRQAKLEALFMDPARSRPTAQFRVGGAQYPASVQWPSNVAVTEHVPPAAHAEFFSSSRLTLNITRAAMAEKGWCPSGRLFEAAACGATLLSDRWSGIEEFYAAGSEILLVDRAETVLAALDLDAAQVRRIGTAARERTLDEHTCHHRAKVLVHALEDARHGALPLQPAWTHYSAAQL